MVLEEGFNYETFKVLNVNETSFFFFLKKESNALQRTIRF